MRIIALLAAIALQPATHAQLTNGCFTNGASATTRPSIHRFSI